ncbi:MHFG family PEP-CTERM protein [Pseudoduganella danionis]|uniref:MHFG family PEP-CTERM protein n=1 Tax=Pseudoduganella danionis TaxID=1890295 RepID=UPI0035AD8C8A
MSITFALALATASVVPAAEPCSWDHPGRNPYRGSIAAAIDRYTDIPPAVASTLKRRMAENQADDKVIITRDAITGREQYAPEIRAMHFGAASVCANVTRSGWSASRQEPAQVYCVGTVCILVPRICGNISRITRLAAAPRTRSGGYGGGAAGTPQNSAPVSPPRTRIASLQGMQPQAAPLRAGLPASTAELPAAPQPLQEFDLTPAALPASVELAVADDAQRYRQPGHAPSVWDSPDGGWHNPGRDSGGGGGGGGGGTGNDNLPLPVPEPASASMLVLGLAVLALARRLCSKRQN